jgi:hypothetical protein
MNAGRSPSPKSAAPKSAAPKPASALPRAADLGVLAALLLALAGAAAAEMPGRGGSLFATLDGDARTCALGKSLVPVSEGDSGLFGNPGAVVLKPELSMSLTHLAYVTGFFGDSVAGIMPVGPGAVIGGSTFLFMHSALPVTSEEFPDGTGALARIANFQGGFLGAQMLGDRVGVGARMRLTYETLGETEIAGVAADLGGVFVATPEIAAGFAVRGLGKRILGRQNPDPIPLTVDLGARWLVTGTPVAVYGAGSMAAYFPSSVAIGAEAANNLGLSLRGSFELREALAFGWALGVGARRDMWNLDYSLAPAGNYGLTHRFTLSARFGGTKGG